MGGTMSSVTPNEVRPFTPTFSFDLVTPDYADLLLSRMTVKQRTLNKEWVKRLSKEMTNDRYRPTPDAVIITVSGLVVNGQHRLRAIVKSGLPQWMVITKGWPEDTYEILDAGFRRALKDRADKDWLRKGHLPVAVVRSFLAGASLMTRNTEGEVLAVADAAEETFVSVLEASPDKVNAAVLGACSRAHINGYPIARIQRFLAVYRRPELSEGTHESSAVLLHRKVNDGAFSTGGSHGRSNSYRYTQSALHHFSLGSAITLLKARDLDLYPLPQRIVELLSDKGSSE